MHIIFGNYGDNTIALIQWAFENQLDPPVVVHVNTGWAAKEWIAQQQAAEALVKRCGYESIELQAQPDFEGLIKDRGRFPNIKFQWCAGFLKGMTFLKWADEIDPALEATVMLGSRRADSRARAKLPEFVSESEHLGDRKVWYPLYQHDDAAFYRLIQVTGMTPLHHRSLECDPCIHNTCADFQRISEDTIQRTVKLEKAIGKTLFDKAAFGDADGIEAIATWAKKTPQTEGSLEAFDMGCGSPFACGE